MIKLGLLFGFLCSSLVVAAPSMLGEISRLEEKKAEKRLLATDVLRLAELYYLSSRCSEVKVLFIFEKEIEKLSLAERKRFARLTCVCGGPCGKIISDELVFKLVQFKKKLVELEKGKIAFHEKNLQKIWKELQPFPEAKSALLKSIRNSVPKNRNELHSLMVELDSEIASYDVVEK